MREKEFTKRRDFLKATGSLAAVGALAGLSGCVGGGSSGGGSSGGGGGGGGSQSTATGGNETVRNEFGLANLDYQLEGNLNVFQWTDYWPTGTIEKFEKAYGVTVNVANYASNEEMFNKLKAGGTGQFDVIFPSDYMVSVLADQGMIQPLDLKKIPSWDNLEQKWIDDSPYDPGKKRYSAPYQWGTSGIGTNTEMADADVSAWDTLWDEQYKGQITMLNDMRETIGLTLKRLGYSLNTKDEAKITEAKEMLVEQKPLLLTYDSVNMDENLINKQASPIHTWSGSAFTAYWELFNDKQGSSPIQYQVPKQGGVVWVDTAAITKEAAHPSAAHAFINYVLNAKVNAMITNYVYYATPNEAAKQHVDKAALDNPAIYPPKEVMQKLEFIKNIGQATQLYSEAWTEIQNA